MQYHGYHWHATDKVDVPEIDRKISDNFLNTEMVNTKPIIVI